MVKSSLSEYREGAMGALMDEYEKALDELLQVVKPITQDQFETIVDYETKDESCRSIQTILSHVIGAGYAYSDYIRDRLGLEITSSPVDLKQVNHITNFLQRMFEYMLETVELMSPFTDEIWMSTLIRTRWGQNYDLEQLLEHAIVHLLRHRRQLEKFLIQLSK